MNSKRRGGVKRSKIPILVGGILLLLALIGLVGFEIDRAKVRRIEFEIDSIRQGMAVRKKVFGTYDRSDQSRSDLRPNSAGITIATEIGQMTRDQFHRVPQESYPYLAEDDYRILIVFGREIFVVTKSDVKRIK